MPPVVIEVEGLSKKYRLGQLQMGYDTLRDAMAGGVSRIAHREHKPKAEEIWALDGVSFEVEQGEVLGIIGPNGAGKSTLLKILTRITTPTRGTATIRGRVGSLLEVGTGFHGELTGRENIYLNGAILGMTRREITRKLDDIVEFSGVEKFIDTPVKRYSSGMYVRLAFSVAAHLEPEILLVDEVLAVGDAEFQRRCLGRMEELSSHGRTVLFVSHQMQVLARLCDRAILLREGRVVQDGPSEQVVAHYLQAEGGSGSLRTWPDLATAPGGKRVRMREVRVVDEHGHLLDSADIRKPVGIEISFTVLRDDVPVFPRIKLIDREGNNAFTTVDPSPQWVERPAVGDYTTVAWIPGNLLNEGLYTVEVGISSLGAIGSNKLVHQAKAPEAVAFHVHDPADGDTSKGGYAGQFRGAVRPLLEWSTHRG
ncbi:MAG TPA: polysaccharide ABC transporter ATP-binding protein [Gaiellaceae bacterium]|nr:polysaccharide ABC transporter ATP-binding protein [Gaiellaceae bacterium]